MLRAPEILSKHEQQMGIFQNFQNRSMIVLGSFYSCFRVPRMILEGPRLTFLNVWNFDKKK